MEIAKHLLALEIEYKRKSIDPNTGDIERAHCNKMIALIKNEIKRLGL